MKLFKKTAALLVAGSILLSPISAPSFLFSSSAEAASSQTLSKGMTGSDVKALQEALALLGYDCGTPDGSFGQKTYDAVVRFQKDVGLDADGKAGVQTQDVLKNLVEVMGGSYATVAPQAVSPSATPKPQATNAQSGEWISAYVTSTWLKMRQSDSSSAKVIKSIPKNAEIKVFNKGTTWCAIEYGGKQGYVMTKYISFTAPAEDKDTTPTAQKTAEAAATVASTKTPTPASTTPPTSAPETAQGYEAYTESTWLKLRKEPSSSATVIKSIPGKAQFTVTVKGDTWCGVEYGGKQGYVMTKYVVFGKVPTGATATPSAAPTSTITSIPTAEIITPQAPTATPSPTKEPDKSQDSTKYTVITTSTWLKLRKEPSSSAAVLKSIPGNTQFTVSVKGDTWCAAEYNGTQGYVMTKYLVFVTETAATPSAKPEQTPQAPTATPSSSQELYAYVTGGSLNLRQSGSTSAKVLKTIPNKTLITVYEKGSEWSRVSYIGINGYVMTKYLDFSTAAAPTSTPSAPTATPPETTIKPDTSLILKTGASGEQVTLMQNRLVALGYLSSASGTYDAATTAAVKAFQKAAGVSTDGVAGPITLKKLYGSDITSEEPPIPQLGAGVGKITPPAASSVKLLHWYNYVKATYRSGQKVLVYDPASGLAWHLRFYAMGHHADSEPVTAEDTLIMYYAFGLKNTWTPKAVWVQLPGGEWTMATMHNVPHLSGSISTNDFDGHLCVHFLRDMSECSKNDPNYGVQHQNALRAAWKALTGETISY